MSLSASIAERPAAFAVDLPVRMKVLLVTNASRTGGWLGEAFAADGAANIQLQETVGTTAGLRRLRDEVFDAVLVTHDAAELDAMEFVEALRAGGSDDPLIILGNEPPQQLDALAYEAGADDYCCLADTTVRGLLWKLARAIRRASLTRDNRRLVQAERQRLEQEHHEAERLLEQQRAMLADLEVINGAPDIVPFQTMAAGEAPGTSAERKTFNELKNEAEWLLASPIANHYRELLRTYIIMGAGNLSREMSALAQVLVTSNVSAQQALQLHVGVIEEVVAGLGNRSARHVMNRADLLALEVVGHLADGYRQRYHDRLCPPRQQLLPGFAPAA